MFGDGGGLTTGSPTSRRLQLHHFCRAMTWLGEGDNRRGGRRPGASCIKDLIEERLFERNSDLFSDMSLVFMDTTSLSSFRSRLSRDFAR
jgi:hypothetical protein